VPLGVRLNKQFGLWCRSERLVMSIVFAMKGSKARTFHGAHSANPLSIQGTWHAQGPQPVDDAGGVPGWAADLFDAMPDVMQIALSTKRGGVLWTRPQPEPQHGLHGMDLSHL
jgi:hypothetical protein